MFLTEPYKIRPFTKRQKTALAVCSMQIRFLQEFIYVPYQA